MTKKQETQYWMLVRQGCTQRLTLNVFGKDQNIFPIFRNDITAKRYIEWTGRNDLSPALIGSIQGETMTGHLMLAIEDGCSHVGILVNFREDGVFGWELISLPKEEEVRI